MKQKYTLGLATAFALFVMVTHAEARPGQLKQSTIHGVLKSIQAHWDLPSDLSSIPLHAEVRINLNTQGGLTGKPDAQITGGTPTQRKRFSEVVTRAIVQAAPFENLPLDKYEAWKQMTIKFESRVLFR
jgi:hypothetical protein